MNKICILFILFTCCINFVTAQDYATGKRVINFIDGARSNRQVSTEVYYPADVAGNDVPPAAGLGKFPIVVFGHGFVIPVTSYTWLADSLVKNGYIVAFPTTESDLSPDHAAFGDDLLFLCNRIISLNDSASSFLFQRVINKAAVAGHSMGGGCSFLAAAKSSTGISAIFNFAAAETNPSASAAASSVNVPSLIFSGSGDCIVPPSVQQQMFTNIIASCKTYINLTGALHCQFANNNGTCALGQLLSGCNSSIITPGVVFDKTISLIIPFLDYYLKAVCIRGDDYINAYDTLTGADKILTCNPLPGCSVLPVSVESFNGQLNNNLVHLKWRATTTSDLLYFTVEKSTEGINFKSLQQVQPTGNVSGTADYTAVDNNPYPGNSYYRLIMLNRDGGTSTSEIIKIVTPKRALALISLFPNPVKNRVQVEMASDKMQKAMLIIYSATGETLMKESIPLNAGLNSKSLSLERLPSGVYNLTFKDDKGMLISSWKIFKE